MKKVGILGGTFNPIHLAHLYIAYEAKEVLELDKVIFMVAGNPPHKKESPVIDSKYRNDMVAYTERAGYCSFATKEQLMNSDIYIINPSGFSDLLESTKNIPNLRLVDIWIDCDSDQLIARSQSRSNSDNWKENYDKEEMEFTKIYPNIDYDKSWHVDNNQYVSAAINHMKQIITVIKHEEIYMSEAKENV